MVYRLIDASLSTVYNALASSFDLKKCENFDTGRNGSDRREKPPVRAGSFNVYLEYKNVGHTAQRIVCRTCPAYAHILVIIPV